MEKKKIKLNFIDYIIILLLVAIVANIVYCIVNNKIKIVSSDDEISKNITISVMFEDIYSELSSAPQIGDYIYDSNYKFLGEITDILVINEKSDDEMHDNEQISVQIKIKSSAKYENEMYTVSDNMILIGNNLNFRSANFSGLGKITSIEVIE